MLFVKLAEVCEVVIELYYQEVGLVLGNIYPNMLSAYPYDQQGFAHPILFDAGAFIKLRNNIQLLPYFPMLLAINLLKHQPIINDALAPSTLYFVTHIWRFPYPLVLHSLLEDPTSHAFSVY